MVQVQLSEERQREINKIATDDVKSRFPLDDDTAASMLGIMHVPPMTPGSSIACSNCEFSVPYEPGAYAVGRRAHRHRAWRSGIGGLIPRMNRP